MEIDRSCLFMALHRAQEGPIHQQRRDTPLTLSALRTIYVADVSMFISIGSIQ
jgi:hypothetical protein